MSPKERLYEYLNCKLLSLNQFSDLCSLNKSVLSRISEATSKATLNKIKQHSDLNIKWLLTGEGSMLIKDKGNVRLVGSAYSAIQGDENVVMLDYISGAATATFIEYIGGGKPEWDKIAVLKQYGEILDESYKVFEVIGESMSPRIPNRAKILTKEIPKTKWEHVEGVAVIAFEDEVVVKRIINNDLAVNNSLVLSSDNPLYGERKVGLADIHAIYKAIRIISADIL